MFFFSFSILIPDISLTNTFPFHFSLPSPSSFSQLPLKVFVCLSVCLSDCLYSSPLSSNLSFPCIYLPLSHFNYLVFQTFQEQKIHLDSQSMTKASVFFSESKHKSSRQRRVIDADPEAEQAPIGGALYRHVFHTLGFIKKITFIDLETGIERSRWGGYGWTHVSA